MKSHHFFALLSLTSGLGLGLQMLPAAADATSDTTQTTVVVTDGKSDEATLREQAAAYGRAYAGGDAAALAAMWTNDGSFTDSDGRIYNGRAAIESYFRQDLQGRPGPTLEIVINSLKFPAPGVAVEEGTTRVASGPNKGAMGRYLVVHTKQSGQWLMQSAAETACAPAAAVNNLKDLDWLVGAWACKGDKGTLHLRADWSKNKTFLVCRFFSGDTQVLTDGVKHPAVEELEIIGWDPIRGNIRSWHFDANGGYGSGRLFNDGKNWRERAGGTEPDGTTDGATYVWTNIDSNNFTWQSSRRTVAGKRLADPKVLTISRESI